MTDERTHDERRMEDRIKLVFYAMTFAIIVPALVYLNGKAETNAAALAAFQVSAADKYVSYVIYRRDMETLMQLVKEVRDDIKAHDRSRTAPARRDQ